MISILMPVYNAGPYLEACLESIVAQTRTDWELIAIDDQSEDESGAILADYQNREPRITLGRTERKGIIPALSKAYALSSGSLITRMDADDIMPADKLQQLSDLVEANSIATGKVKYFRSDGELGDGYRRYEQWLNELVDNNSHWEAIYKECVIPSPAWMMKRETLDAIGAFDSDIYPEDYDLVFRAYAASLKVKGTKAIVHHWRDHGQRSSRSDPNYADNRFLDLKLKYFLDLDYDSSQPLALWGAGDKGKYIARYLMAHEVPFTWHTDNARKIGHDIYGTILQASTELPHHGQVLVLIANPLEQELVSARLAQSELAVSHLV